VAGRRSGWRREITVHPWKPREKWSRTSFSCELIQGAFWLDVFLPMILRRECDSDHKKPKANFLSSEVKLTSLTNVWVVFSSDLFSATHRTTTLPRNFHCLLRYSWTFRKVKQWRASLRGQNAEIGGISVDRQARVSLWLQDSLYRSEKRLGYLGLGGRPEPPLKDVGGAGFLALEICFLEVTLTKGLRDSHLQARTTWPFESICSPKIGGWLIPPINDVFHQHAHRKSLGKSFRAKRISNPGGVYRAIPDDGGSSNIYSTLAQEEIDAVEWGS
jgi:hypothetical protein